MSIARVQFNPSTLKASYNPATGKVQVLSPQCGFCDGNTPFEIVLTFSGLEMCEFPCFVIDDCDEFRGGRSEEYTINLADALNGSHVLTYVSGCQWRADVPISGRYNLWVANAPGSGCSCDGKITQFWTYTTILILATIGFGSVTVVANARGFLDGVGVIGTVSNLFLGGVSHTGCEVFGSGNNNASPCVLPDFGFGNKSHPVGNSGQVELSLP